MRLLGRAAAVAALIALAAIALAACTVGPDYEPPRPLGIQSWNDKSARGTDPAARIAPGTNPDPQWWDGFNDPVLTELEKRAIAGNLDLQQAVLRVVEARQNEIAARAAGLPSLGGTGSYMREQLGAKGILESSGLQGQVANLSAPGSPLNQFSPGLGNKVGGAAEGALNKLTQPVNLYQYGLDASWELDLFGKVRRSVEQAQASTEAQSEAANDALVMLEGQVAQAYVQVRGAQALLASQQENVAAAQASLDLTLRQQRQGLATQLDVDQAATQLGNNQAQLPGYEKQAQQAINQLCVLVGQPPSALDPLLTPPAPMPAIPAVVGIGVPAELARRRPDIREAEAQLHAATANVGVATASFYPDVSLTGNVGLRALDASYLTNWASLFYAFGPSVSVPIFQGGKLTASLRLARAQQVAAALAYRNTVLNALKEVENALVAYRTDRAARDRIADTIRSSEQALYLARDAYKNGLSSFLQVLDAERTLVQSRQQLIQADITLTNDVIALYNALGGGWQETASVPDVPPIDLTTPLTPAALDRVAAVNAQ
jgi:NodT family efflux transporter outer membrane factor (OMF) lipoprotein